MDWKIIKRKWNFFKITNLSSRGILRNKYFDNIDPIKDLQSVKIQNIYGIKNEQIEAEIEFYDDLNKKRLISSSDDELINSFHLVQPFLKVL